MRDLLTRRGGGGDWIETGATQNWRKEGGRSSLAQLGALLVRVQVQLEPGGLSTLLITHDDTTCGMRPAGKSTPAYRALQSMQLKVSDNTCVQVLYYSHIICLAR